MEEVKNSELKEVEKLAEEVKLQFKENPVSSLTPQQMKEIKAMKKESRLFQAVQGYCKKNKTTPLKEYKRIIDKESKMPRAQRDYLQSVMEYTPTEEEVQAIAERDARLKKYQEEE